MQSPREVSILHIDSVIYGNVGIEVIGGRPGVVRDVELRGSQSNTFTGDTVLTSGGLRLAKNNGVTAIRGDIRARQGSAVGLFHDNQINDSSDVYLSGSSTLFFVSQYDTSLTERFRRLIVEGVGIVDFNATYVYRHYARWLYLDDLIINGGGKLIVKSWVNGTDHLLVRRENVDWATLWKIDFQGKANRNVGYRNFNSDYVEIVPWATPESETYGAIFGALGLGLVGWRSKARRAFLLRHKKVHSENQSALIREVNVWDDTLRLSGLLDSGYACISLIP